MSLELKRSKSVLDFLQGCNRRTTGEPQEFACRAAIVAGQSMQPLWITHENMGGADLDTDRLQFGEGS